MICMMDLLGGGGEKKGEMVFALTCTAIGMSRSASLPHTADCITQLVMEHSKDRGSLDR